jgi:hypothetical protein
MVGATSRMGKGEEDGADLLPLKLELKSHKSHFGSSLSQNNNNNNNNKKKGKNNI